MVRSTGIHLVSDVPITLRPAVPADRDGIRGLMKASLGEGVIPRTDAFWAWKHEINPFGPSPVLVAEADGVLVGLRAFMRWTWWTGDREFHAVRAVDTATHPDWQGRGIFKRLTLALRETVQAEGVSFVYNTPNDQSRPGYLKMGWTAVGRPSIWVRPRRPVRLLGAYLRGLSGGKEGTPPEVEAESAGAHLLQPTVRAIADRAAGSPRTAFHTRRTAEYLRWRYAVIPDFRYHALSKGEGDDGAIVVLRTRRRGAIAEIRICDVVVGQTAGARRNAVSLLRDAARVADADVAIAMPGSIDGASMAMAGYLPVPNVGPVLTVFPLNEASGAPDPLVRSSWRLSVGDLELF